MKTKKYSYISLGVLSLILLASTKSLANQDNDVINSIKTTPAIVKELSEKRQLLMDKVQPIKRERAN